MMGKCELCGETHQETLEVHQWVRTPDGVEVAIPHIICSDCNTEILAETAPEDIYDLEPEIESF